MAEKCCPMNGIGGRHTAWCMRNHCAECGLPNNAHDLGCATAHKLVEQSHKGIPCDQCGKVECDGFSCQEQELSWRDLKAGDKVTVTDKNGNSLRVTVNATGRDYCHALNDKTLLGTTPSLVVFDDWSVSDDGYGYKLSDLERKPKTIGELLASVGIEFDTSLEEAKKTLKDLL